MILLWLRNFFLVFPNSQNVQTIFITCLELNSIDQIASMADKILEFSGRLTSLKSECDTHVTDSKVSTALR